MIHDLSDRQWHAVDQGVIVSPTGTRYTRRSTRSRRRDVDVLVRGGAPVVVYSFAGGLLDWYDGDDAAEVWNRTRGDLTTGAPGPRRDGRVVWTAGMWQSQDRHTLVVLTGHC